MRVHDAGRRNLVAALQLFAANAPGAVVGEREGTLMAVSAMAATGAFHAPAIRRDSRTAPATVLAAVRAFGAEQGRDLVLWADAVADADLAAAARADGHAVASTGLGMVLEGPPGPARPVPGARLVPVEDAAGVAAFATVHRAGYGSAGFPTELVDHFATPGALLAPSVDAVVATVDGQPLATALTLASGGPDSPGGPGPAVAGVYWVATHPDALRRGLGALVTRAVVLRAQDRGARTIVLQATPAGEPVYRALGFRPFVTYERYLVPRAEGLSRRRPAG